MLGISTDLSCNAPKPLKKLMEKENENPGLVHSYILYTFNKKTSGRKGEWAEKLGNKAP